MQYIFVVINGLLLWHAVESSPITDKGLQTSWSSITNIRRLISEQNDLLRLTSSASNYLVKFQGCFKKNNINTLAEFLFSVEGENLILTCGSCTPPSKQIHWRWITFEGVDSALSQSDLGDDNDALAPISYYQNQYQQLVLTFPKPDLSSYYCYWEDTNQIDGSTIRVISKIFTVEIVGVAHMQKMSVRSLLRNESNYSGIRQITPVVTGRRKIAVTTQWSEWSACSKCGGVAGKRYKTGFCSVTNEISQESDATSSNLEVLQLYTLPISCSLLIDFHPDILSESSVLKDISQASSLNHVLGRAPIILIGYCRTKRDNCVGDDEGDKVGKNKAISQLYKDFEMKGEGQSMVEGKEEESRSARRILWLVQSLANGIPLGWNNIPEVVALVGLVAFQIYVIYLVLKWRNDAH